VSVEPGVLPASTVRLSAGTVISAVPVLFLLFDSVIKVMTIDPVVESFAQLGYPVSLALGIGIVELVCLALYVIPRTATHVRVGSPVFTHALFPIYVAALVWGGLFLREARLRALLPLRS
jgi:hypothetical protein